MKSAVAYVRVSRVGGRGGDSFLSPDIQVEAISAMALRLSFKVIDTITELDASGGDASREGWQRAISMVETGKARAVLVYNLSRFSRSQRDALEAIDRIKAAGGELHSAQEGSFDDSPAGSLLRDTILRFAQFERDRAKEGFAVAQASAIDRGLFIAARIPLGYHRDLTTRKLVIDPETAPLIVEVFERRAVGESWGSLATWLRDSGGSPTTERTTVKWIVSNVTYLGWSRSGEKVNKKAHPSIVSQLLFDGANAVKGRRPPYDGRISAQALLAGLVTCDGCGHKMQVSMSRGHPGYSCRSLNCTAHAGIKAEIADAEVVARLFAYVNRVDPATIRTPGNEAKNEVETHEVRKAHEEAVYDRKVFISNREIRRMLTPDEYNEELAALSEAVIETGMALEMTQAKEDEPEKVEDFNNVWETWTIQSRREFLSRFLSAVVVRSAKRNRHATVSDRLAMHLAPGNTALTDRWLLPEGDWSSEPFETA